MKSGKMAELDMGFKPTKHQKHPEKRGKRGARSTERGAKPSTQPKPSAEPRPSEGAGADGRTGRPRRGMGGSRSPRPAARPPARGPLTQRPSPPDMTGALVNNESGRGVWGSGTVVAVVPAGVSPYFFCRRNGIPQMFRPETCAVPAPRYIVMGDDGRLHAPERVSWRTR